MSALRIMYGRTRSDSLDLHDNAIQLHEIRHDSHNRVCFPGRKTGWLRLRKGVGQNRTELETKNIFVHSFQESRAKLPGTVECLPPMIRRVSLIFIRELTAEGSRGRRAEREE